MAYWLFSYNIPLVMNNFFYVMMILITVAGCATGFYAAKAYKKAEALMPADEAYEQKKAERVAAKEAKKAAKAK
jgi:formate hydrogenlyase subunit 3/multisubunit Na+/H+ antiporter MnhD subunit